MTRMISRSAAIVACVLLAACGGGATTGGGASAVPGKTSSAASATFVVKIPAKASVTSSKRPAYITSNVQAIDFTAISTANSTVSTYVFYPLTSSSSYCSGTASTGLTCTLPVSAPPGQDTITVNLYDATEPGQAYIISTGSITQTINDQQSNTINITTDGVPTFAILGATNPYPTGGTAASVPLSLQVTDPDGNIIVGSFDMPLTLTNSDTSGATQLSKTSLTQMSDLTGLSLSYNGTGGAAATITVNSTSPAYASRSNFPALASFTVVPGGIGPAVNPAILTFAHANSAAQTITVTGVNTGTATFTVTNGCGGFATVSGSSPTFTITPVASTFSSTAPLYQTYGYCQLTVTDGTHSTNVGVMVGQ